MLFFKDSFINTLLVSLCYFVYQIPDQKLPEMIGKALAKNANAVINLTETLSMYERVMDEYDILKGDFDVLSREKSHLQTVVLDMRSRADHRQVFEYVWGGV